MVDKKVKEISALMNTTKSSRSSFEQLNMRATQSNFGRVELSKQDTLGREAISPLSPKSPTSQVALHK